MAKYKDGRMRRFWVGFIVLCLLVPQASQARPELCDQVARHAARDQNIPSNVMLAVTRVETGRARNGVVQPWPWTANVGGDGHWFDTADALRQFLFRQVKAGTTNFDVGCFQINHRWHGQAFASLDDMIDPVQNAAYAARFLRELYSETGDWTAAVGKYHSRTPEHANLYTRKYRQIQANLTDIPPAGPRRPAALFAEDGGRPAVGSLVPLNSAGARPLFGPRTP